MTDFDSLAHWHDRAVAAEREAERLKSLVLSLADRVLAQSELLAKRAERPPTPTNPEDRTCPPL